MAAPSKVKLVGLIVVIMLLGAAGTALLFREPRGDVGVDQFTGNWTSDCIPVSHQNLTRVRKTVSISAVGSVEVGERYFRDENCEQLAIFYEADGKLVRGLKPGEHASQVRLTIGEVKVTVSDSGLLAEFAAAGHCGKSEWKEGEAVVFTDGKCDLLTPGGATSYSDFIEVIDGDLVLGTGLTFFPSGSNGADAASLLSGSMTLSR